MQSQILGHSRRDNMGPSHSMDINSNQILINYSYTFCTTIVQAYLADQTPLQIKGFVTDLLFTFLLQQHSDIFLYQRHQSIGVKALCRHQLDFVLDELYVCCFQQWGPVVSCGVQTTILVTTCIVWGGYPGTLWPISHLDVAQQWSLQVNLVTRDVQLGSCLPWYLKFLFRSSSHIWNLLLYQVFVLLLKWTLILAVSLPIPSLVPPSPLFHLILQGSSTPIHSYLFILFSFPGERYLSIQSFTLYLTSVVLWNSAWLSQTSHLISIHKLIVSYLYFCVWIASFRMLYSSVTCCPVSFIISLCLTAEQCSIM